MKINEIQWNQWNPMKSMKSNENQWNPMKINGIQWKMVKINENQWISKPILKAWIGNPKIQSIPFKQVGSKSMESIGKPGQKGGKNPKNPEIIVISPIYMVQNGVFRGFPWFETKSWTIPRKPGFGGSFDFLFRSETGRSSFLARVLRPRSVLG